MVLAVLHNAVLATEGLSDTDAVLASAAIEKAKLTNKSKKDAALADELAAHGIPPLSLPSSNPAGNNKVKKEGKNAKEKEHKRDSKHKDQVVKPAKVCFFCCCEETILTLPL
jgi:hypothetical protein